MSLKETCACMEQLALMCFLLYVYSVIFSCVYLRVVLPSVDRRA